MEFEEKLMENALDWYSLCVVVLFLKMFTTSAYQGFYRLSQGVFLNPEDAQVFQKPPATEELPQVQRAAKAWLNDLENNLDDLRDAVNRRVTDLSTGLQRRNQLLGHYNYIGQGMGLPGNGFPTIPGAI
jgi:arginine decarboxylase-like protein